MVALTDPAAETPWAGGHFDRRRGAPRLLFGRTFEDPAIEQSLFPSSGTVLCIASAGDTARALAGPGRRVIAVDVNPTQIHEVRRRLAGHAPRPGSADRLLGVGRAALRPAGWTPERLRELCALDDGDAQVQQWSGLVSTPVRLLVRSLLSRRVLRLAYGPSFATLTPPRFGDVVLDRMGSRIGLVPSRENPWLSLVLTGQWPRPEPWVDPAHIDLRTGDVATILEALEPGSLDGISLSNVLDGPGPAYAERLLSAAHTAARAGAPIVLRTFLDPEDAAGDRLAARDRSLLWGAIDVIRG